ncbi:hypothetical protein MLD38_036679 [Melastoma candidum]|uniref:Uncharacterized protein n=1 Tax=Melastoma candidum TaxID=119954 RepID=A0ACB9LKI3_9MYRT|nr:hypothetical protein MLD38_036679 [Melastoma candidum]
MAESAAPSLLFVLAAASLLFHVHCGYPLPATARMKLFHDPTMRLRDFKASLDQLGSASPGPPSERSQGTVYDVTSYGADPFGGVRINLQGGTYVISRPLQFPSAGVGNIVIHGGTLQASADFPMDGYLIDLSNSNGSMSYYYEFITFRDLLLDANYRGGGILVRNSLRIGIDNCFIAHFSSNGILVQGGHETYVRNSFLGQHITAGSDPGERNFSGIGINLQGNDNAVTDVVIFSAMVGIMVTSQANTFSGVHCYNKATSFGGTGIYLKVPGNTQTRIVNCYMDFTGIVMEDPVQVDITDSFFLGDAYVVLKSINGVAKGVNVVNNLFTGSNKGIDTVQLDVSNGPFKQVDRVVVERNGAVGMNSRLTNARGSTQGNGTRWEVDFSSTLLLPDMISYVQYSLKDDSTGSFPKHALRNVTKNSVVIESEVVVSATVFVMVDQMK